jgi:NAD(P)H-hydrate epimerase
MENAGRSAAEIVSRLYPEGPVVGLVGGGNNGGDAVVVLRTLAAWGRSVRAIHVSERPPDALLHGWPIPSSVADPGDGPELAVILAEAGVVIDGILGTGVRGAPRDRQAHAIRALNQADAPVVSLDIPSGVDAATGAVPGEAVSADVTIAFGWPKLGTTVPPGRLRSGRLMAVEIGFPPGNEAEFGARLITPGWAHGTKPVRTPETHKYRVGTLLLVAGGSGMAGAAVMAGRAAQRAGLGLLRVASVPENRSVLQATVPEAVFVDATDATALEQALEGVALAVGPGLGRDAAAGALIDRVLNAQGQAPVVLDADALTLAGDGRMDGLRAMAARRPVVVTPHLGELERISDATRAQVEEDRFAVARRVAADLGATVLLKGMPSVVAEPAGRVLVDTVATSDLATGGMGDVLTGALGSFLAQGASAADAAGLALYHTGRAARLAERGAGLIPDDVIERLPTALAESGNGWTDLDLPSLCFDQDLPR